MSKIIIIKKNEEFQNIFEKGHSIYGKYLVVYFLHNSLDVNRFGFCVGKKIGNAVMRNYIKRLLREAVRTVMTPSFKGKDILFVARNNIKVTTLANIISEITHILDKMNKIQTLKNKTLINKKDGFQ